MYGAILGDMIGEPHEFSNTKTKEFELLGDKNRFTDDTVMTIAVADGIMNAGLDASVENIKYSIVKSMLEYGRRYPNAGYGTAFGRWLSKRNPEPYGSWGNGAAMRVSSIAWLFHDDFDKALEVARASAEVSHNHPEAVKAAECTTAIIWFINHGYDKEFIRKLLQEEQYYEIDKTCDEIRKDYKFDVSCQGTMPAAIAAFLEGTSYEDVVRTAISLGGDADTIAAIAGGMAEAYYGIPEHLKRACRAKMGRQKAKDLLEVLDRFWAVIEEGKKNIGVQKADSMQRRKSHPMQIRQDEIFDAIVSGEKTFELRLYDEKRKQILPGDVILFEKSGTTKRHIAKVKAMHLYRDFEQMFANIDASKCGCKAEHMREYYSDEEVAKYSVVAIELEPINGTV